MSLKDKYAIVGVGYTSQDRVPDRTALSFYVEVGANAIQDAGLTRKDMDGLLCYRRFEPALRDRERCVGGGAAASEQRRWLPA